ncbi:Chlorophyll(ide) b reductase NOL chloroplastic [Bienertia sinuspersici]
MATTSTACFYSPILLLKSNNPPKVLFHSSIPTLQSSYLTLSPRHNYINPNSVYNIRTPFKLFEAQASFNSEIQPMVPPFNVLITGSSRGTLI